MSHDHPHRHDHGHDHAHGDAAADSELTPALDPDIPDAELAPADLSRRTFLRRAGVVGVGATAAAAGIFAAPGAVAADRRFDEFGRTGTHRDTTSLRTGLAVPMGPGWP